MQYNKVRDRSLMRENNLNHPRRKARESALQALYALEMNNGYPADILDLYDESHFFIEAGNSPLGISFDSSKNNIFVSNWYDDVISVIDFVTKKKKHEIKVGQSPAGIYFDKKNQKLNKEIFKLPQQN